MAKTISAYDMSVSDAIYGATDRYVSRRRLRAMLEYEYTLLLERLHQKRGEASAFFVFANTVTTRREGGHGWLGVRFSRSPVPNLLRSSCMSGCWTKKLCVSRKRLELSV